MGGFVWQCETKGPSFKNFHVFHSKHEVFGDDVYRKLFSLNTAPRAIAGLGVNNQSFLSLTRVRHSLSLTVTAIDKKDKAVPCHLHSWVWAESLPCSLGHFNIIIKGLRIHLEWGLEVEQVMWLLLNKVMWPYSSTSVLWHYGDTGLEIHSSLCSDTLFQNKAFMFFRPQCLCIFQNDFVWLFCKIFLHYFFYFYW